MVNMRGLGLGLLAVILAGCTIAERTETSVHFTATGAEITLTQIGVKSSETRREKIKSDFDSFIGDYENAESRLGRDSSVLLDKSLDLDGDRIVVSYRIFAPNGAQALDEMEIKNLNGEILHILGEAQGTSTLLSTNASVFRTDSNVVLAWPGAARDLSWTVQDSNAIATPNNMLPLYRAWRAGGR